MYQNPIIQVNEQRLKLKNLLVRLGFGELDIHTLVVFTNQNGILNLDAACETRIRSEQVPDKIRGFCDDHGRGREKYSQSEISNLAFHLKNLHSPWRGSVVEKYGVDRSFVMDGVRCAQCGAFGVNRNKRNWHCLKCGHVDRDAHLRALTDYALIFGPEISNREAREFFRVESRHAVYRILQNKDIKQIKQARFTKYDLSGLINLV